ncbi:MAG: flagellar hook-basal body complex protein FliE [Pseudomonadota bacterium]
MPIDATTSASQALGAYTKTAKIAGMDGVDSTGASQPQFGDVLNQAVGSAIDTMKAGEKASADAVTGSADLNDVVQAVTAAELTLQTVVAIRDRLIGALQEMIRMPI